MVKRIKPLSVIKVNLPLEVNMTEVKSSQIESIGMVSGIDGPNCRVFIKFHSGGLYMYHSVPIKVYMSLISAESHGSFFIANIKGTYGYEKIL